MNAFTKKPNLAGFVKELGINTKKQKAGIIRAKEVRDSETTSSDFTLKPKEIKNQNAFTKKPNVSEFTRKLRASESSKVSGISRANQVSTCEPGGSLFPKVSK